MTYKPELDGLRAIAVFLVLLCHMELAGATGGFIGVDIFFVISGFLITSIIMGGIEKENFGFWNFFGRRFVRLYPALLVALTLTFIAGFLLADTDTFERMARTGRYVLFSVSNIFFNNNLGYFDAAAQKQVFLHTWSLGVEWQFYLAWPVIIWTVMKFTRKRSVLFTVIALITLASLIGSQWAVHNNIKAAYYLVHYRAFELGIGGLLMFLYPRELSPTQGKLLVAAGLITILALSFIFYHPKMLFPGLAGLVPCLAAVACMWGGKAFTKGNLLRWPFVIYIGKASYSIYLVHWPLLLMTKYYLYRHLETSERVILVIVSLVLGSALYSLVETRVNWRRLPNKLVGSLVLLALTIAMALGLLYISKASKGLPWRLAETNFLVQPQYHDWGVSKFPENAVLGNPEGKLIAVIGGDSFSANMSTGFHDYLAARNQKMERYYKPGCLISLAELKTFIFEPVCRATSQLVLETVQKYPELPLILIQAWGGPAVDADTRGVPVDMRAQEVYNEQIAINLNDIRARVGQYRPIFLVASPPYRHWATGEKECLLRPELGKQACVNQIPPYEIKDSPVYLANMAIKAYAQAHANVYYIDSSAVACPEGMCTSEHNAMLYFDGFHTSVYGAEIIVNDAMRQIEPILAAISKQQHE